MNIISWESRVLAKSDRRGGGGDENVALNRSKPIQIASGGGDTRIGRTPSELQLRREEILADHRDYCMFQRIVTGILERAKHEQDPRQRSCYGRSSKDSSLPQRTHQVLQSIVRTRNNKCIDPINTNMSLTNLTTRPHYYHNQDNNSKHIFENHEEEVLVPSTPYCFSSSHTHHIRDEVDHQHFLFGAHAAYAGMDVLCRSPSEDLEIFSMDDP